MRGIVSEVVVSDVEWEIYGREDGTLGRWGTDMMMRSSYLQLDLKFDVLSGSTGGERCKERSKLLRIAMPATPV